MNETLKTIHSLRSVHGNFTSQAISDGDLKTILEAAVRAATASARQSYSIIVVDDPGEMREYLQYVGSKALIFCVDYHRLITTAEYLNYHPRQDGLIDFITGSTDTILAAQTAAIAAKSLGIDSLFTNSIHRGDLAKFYQNFKLPSKYCFPLVALILGYPVEPNHPTRGRLTGPGVIHFQKYQHPSPAEIAKIIADYDDPAQNMGLTFRPGNPETRYLDWFFNVWSKPKAAKQAKQKQAEIYQLLEGLGFIDAEHIRSNT